MVSKSGSMQHYLTWITLYRLRHHNLLCQKPESVDQKTKKLCAIVHELAAIVCKIRKFSDISLLNM